MTGRLEQLLAEHLASTFPASVEKGLDYGDVEPVLIDAAIYGWAVTIAKGSGLDAAERWRFSEARDDLECSLHLLPGESLSYFRRLVVLADMASAFDPGSDP